MRAASAALPLLLVLLFNPVAAQTTDLLHLGDDPTGDAKFQGQSYPDTLADITSMDIQTDGSDLVFFLNLAGSSTEAGSMCFVAAFQVGETEYLAFDCFECAAYECTNAASEARPPSSSRGTRVGSVELVPSGAKITVGMSEIGVEPGMHIDDIYGLTYLTRVLYVADAAPDAKTDKDASESFGSYIVGANYLGLVGPDPSTEAPVTTIYEDLTTANVTQSFDEATFDTYVFNFTNGFPNATATIAWNSTGGSVTFTITGGNETVEETYAGTGNQSIAFLDAPLGPWNLTLAYDGFVGTFDFAWMAMEDTPHSSPEPEDGAPSDGAPSGSDGGTQPGKKTGTGGPGEPEAQAVHEGEVADGNQESPSLGLAVLLIGLLAIARRRS